MRPSHPSVRARVTPTRPRAASTLLTCVAALCAPVALHAQGGVTSGARADGTRASACDPRDTDDNGGDRGSACERRSLTLAPRAAVRVEAGPNGGVDVRGADSVRATRVTAIVTANARTDDEAARLAAEVEIVDDGGTLRARGPSSRDRRWWSVRWRLEVPRRTDLDLRANNGGLRVAGVTGRMELETNNGGIIVDSTGGAVVARANNGGVIATLSGRAWDAAGLGNGGLDLHSNNGGAILRVPEGYSARVRVGSNNGPLAVDFPITVQGRVDKNRLDLTLGAGGPPVEVTTNNGAARLGRVP